MCFYSLIINKLIFTYNILDNCKSEEYYYESQSNPIICLEKCDKYYNGTDLQICVDNCADGEFIHPGDICSDSSCPSSVPFFYTIEISNDPSHRVNLCVPNCKNDEYCNYDYSLNTYSRNECLESCAGYIYNGGCYSICPERLYIQNEGEGHQKCVSNCKNKFYFNTVLNRSECLDNCTEVYPFLTSSGECVKQCPINELYIGSNNKCLTSCEK